LQQKEKFERGVSIQNWTSGYLAHQRRDPEKNEQEKMRTNGKRGNKAEEYEHWKRKI
jgi:hypothetical protein